VKGKAKKWSTRVVERESNGRRRPAWFIYFFLIPNPNRFDSVRFGLASSGTPEPKIEPNRKFS